MEVWTMVVLRIIYIMFDSLKTTVWLYINKYLFLFWKYFLSMHILHIYGHGNCNNFLYLIGTVAHIKEHSMETFVLY